jgi:hypothetical protein
MPAMFTPEFTPWPKLPRLNRDIIITEKIDGSNAAIHFDEEGNWAAQSRKRIIVPQGTKAQGTDNYGFAQWVEDHAEFSDLGPGLHFGEWWGKGIMRNYGREDRVFSLFNTTRWAGRPGVFETPNLDVVPVLYSGPFATVHVNVTMLMLQMNGSVAQPGWNKPEGIVVFHTAANQMFKVTIENDDNPKSVLPGRGESIG